MSKMVVRKKQKKYIVKMWVKFRYSEKAAKIRKKNILLRFETTE